MNRSTVMKGLAAVVSVVVVAALAGAAYVLGSPAQQRQLRLDERRLEDLVAITDFIQSYAKKHDALPQDLAALDEEAKAAGNRQLPTDPDSHAPYEYKALDAQSWQLCAVFALPSPDENGRIRYGGIHYVEQPSAHADGKQCFKYTRPHDDDGGKRP